MGTERVDKAWQGKGLDMYSLEAIFGTLGHYGVTVDQPGFLELAKAEFPIGVAMQWHERWKGTGQFLRFPAAAAEELWRRLLPGELAPSDVAVALANLVTELAGWLDGKKDEGTRETRFKVVEAYLPTLPPAGDRREKFMAELVFALGEVMRSLDALAVALLKTGHEPEAVRFAALEEALFPVRAGVVQAQLRAARGDVDGAAADLIRIADDTARDDFTRISAAKELIVLGRSEEPQRVLVTLMERAEKERDVELASELVEVLSELLRRNPRLKDKEALRDRVERLEQALGPAPVH